MKKNRMMRLAAILLVCVLLSTSVISGTFAKYTTQASATDAARVAKWDIQINGSQMQATHTFAFDLFNTIVDTKDGNGETDIKATDGSIIAPGTKGQMSFTLKNDSEVTASYAIVFGMTETEDIPVQFSLTGENGTWTDDICNLNFNVPIANIGDEQTVTVYWQWDFEGDDTALGLKGTDVITITATVTATQVD